MTGLAWILGVVLAVSLVAWGLVLRGAIMLFRVPRLGDLDAPEPAPWPRLSVVIPACNEVHTIEPAVRSLLAQDYPSLEVVLVDDRSSDGTGEMVDRLAAADPRVVAVHVRELPKGWLGKVWALQTGLGHATGEWVLFTDADVHFATGALRRLVAAAVARRLDHLAGLPAAWRVSLPVDIMVAHFLRALLTAVLPPWGVENPASRRFFGVGACNLVRREALDRTVGLGWLRMETADDMGVGLLMKQSGAHCLAVSAFDELGLWWHRSIADAAHGLEKGYAALGRCQAWRLLVMALPGALVDASPLWGPVVAGFPFPWPVRVLGGAVAAVFVVATVLFARWGRVSAWPGLLTPLLAPLFTALLLRTAWLGWRRDGIAWRGTVYRCQALREGMRVKIPF